MSTRHHTDTHTINIDVHTRHTHHIPPHTSSHTHILSHTSNTHVQTCTCGEENAFPECGCCAVDPVCHFSVHGLVDSRRHPVARARSLSALQMTEAVLRGRLSPPGWSVLGPRHTHTQSRENRILASDLRERQGSNAELLGRLCPLHPLRPSKHPPKVVAAVLTWVTI